MPRRLSEMCGRGYFSIRVLGNTVRIRSYTTTSVRGRLVSSLTMLLCPQCTLFCHGIKKFSTKWMS